MGELEYGYFPFIGLDEPRYLRTILCLVVIFSKLGFVKSHWALSFRPKSSSTISILKSSPFFGGFLSETSILVFATAGNSSTDNLELSPIFKPSTIILAIA